MSALPQKWVIMCDYRKASIGLLFIIYTCLFVLYVYMCVFMYVHAHVHIMYLCTYVALYKAVRTPLELDCTISIRFIIIIVIVVLPLLM